MPYNIFFNKTIKVILYFEYIIIVNFFWLFSINKIINYINKILNL